MTLAYDDATTIYGSSRATYDGDADDTVGVGLAGVSVPTTRRHAVQVVPARRPSVTATPQRRPAVSAKR